MKIATTFGSREQCCNGHEVQILSQDLFSIVSYKSPVGFLEHMLVLHPTQSFCKAKETISREKGNLQNICKQLI